MPELRFTLLAERIIVDSRSNNLTIINVIEVFNVAGIPVKLGDTITVVNLWAKKANGDDDAFVWRIKLVPPSGDETEIMPESNTSFEGKQRYRNIMAFKGIEFKQYGKHQFVTEIKNNGGWVEVGRCIFEVQQSSRMN